MPANGQLGVSTYDPVSVRPARSSLLSRSGPNLPLNTRGAEAIAKATTGLRRLGPSADPGELVEAGDVSPAIEALRADAQVLRDVFGFGRDFGWVQIAKEDGQGFEQLEVDW